MPNPHATSTVTDCFGRQVDVDTAMVPILRSLWDRGWDTISSCQGPGRSFAHGTIFAHVVFNDADHAHDFAELCGRSDTAHFIRHCGQMFDFPDIAPYDAVFSNYEITRGRRKKTLWEVKLMTTRWPLTGASVFFECNDRPFIERALTKGTA